MKTKKIILLISCAVIFSFGLSTVFSLYSLNSLILTNSKEESLIYANEISSSVNSIFAEPRAVAMSINNPFVRDYVKNVDAYSEKELSDVFKNYLAYVKKYFNYNTAFIAPKANLRYYTEHGYSVMLNPDNDDNDWFEAFLDSKIPYELNIDNDQANGNEITAYINVRMEDENGNAIGACGVGLNVNEISSEIGKFENMKGYSVMLVSKNGKIQVSSNADYKSEVLSKKSSLVNTLVSEEIKKEINSYDALKNYKYVQREKDSFYIIKYIDECQWYLVISYDDPSLPKASDLLLKNILACFSSLLLILVITNFIVSKYQNKVIEFKTKSEYDKLTGLYNRRAFEERKRILLSEKTMENITVAVFDIDSLKKVNDANGHAVGDYLIQEASKIIKSYFEPYGISYRTGGDEFVVIMDHEFDDIPARISEFKNLVSQWHGTLVRNLHISIGVVSGSLYEYESIEELIDLADKKMYRDKKDYYRSLEERKA